jgi:hypothetical protein
MTRRAVARAAGIWLGVCCVSFLFSATLFAGFGEVVVVLAAISGLATHYILMSGSGFRRRGPARHVLLLALGASALPLFWITASAPRGPSLLEVPLYLVNILLFTIPAATVVNLIDDRGSV